MNEEFSSRMMLGMLQQGDKKGKKAPSRPERMPIELALYNRAVVNFLFVLVFLTNAIINFD